MRVRVCSVAELPPQSAQVVESGDLSIAVFNVGGELFALDNACAHTGGPIVDGLVRDGTVTCPLHWWRFDLATGERRGAPHIAQATYSAMIDGEDIVVEVPEPAAPVGMREMLLRHAAEWKASRGSESG